VREVERQAGHVPLGMFEPVPGAIEGAERLRSQ
jgi:hypothetical protein